MGLRQRARLVYSLLKRKDTSEKLNAMNRFRKNQRDFEKKEMHAVLTDLNHKMEAINEKSTEYREKLQQSIHQLGELGAHKLDALIERNATSNMKAFFERYRRKAVARNYRLTIKHNVFELAHRYLLREVFTKIGMKAHVTVGLLSATFAVRCCASSD
ncbi:MAG: hypothetical protein JST59_00110 [Actinobacteria bacterium]|nr:hypothetical protein [Actinomycetota bacterium]